MEHACVATITHSNYPVADLARNKVIEASPSLPWVATAVECLAAELNICKVNCFPSYLVPAVKDSIAAVVEIGEHSELQLDQEKTEQQVNSTSLQNKLESGWVGLCKGVQSQK